MVRERITDSRTMKLGITNWKVDHAFPPSDIIWPDIQNVAENDISIKKYLYVSLNYIISFLVVAVIIFFDHWLFRRNNVP